jgi:hypothetical protein
VPDSVSDDAAALCEPLSVGIAAVRKAGLDGGSRVLITGAGRSASWSASSRGPTAPPTSWSAIRRAPPRAGDEFGRDAVLDPSRTDRRLGVDAFIDASGAPSAVGRRHPRGAAGRHVVLVGSGAESMELPTQLIQNRELVLTGRVPLRQHVADGDRARRVRSGWTSGRDGRPRVPAREAAEASTPTARRVASRPVVACVMKLSKSTLAQIPIDTPSYEPRRDRLSA